MQSHLSRLYLSALLIIVAKLESISSNFMPYLDSDFTAIAFVTDFLASLVYPPYRVRQIHTPS